MVVTDALRNMTESQRVRIKHRAAKVPWEPITAGPNHIDVGRARCDLFLKNHRSHIDQGQDASLNDFFLADRTPRYMSFGSKRLNNVDHFGIRQRLPATNFVAVEPTTRLLAKPAEFSEMI